MTQSFPIFFWDEATREVLEATEQTHEAAAKAWCGVVAVADLSQFFNAKAALVEFMKDHMNPDAMGIVVVPKFAPSLSELYQGVLDAGTTGEQWTRDRLILIHTQQDDVILGAKRVVFEDRIEQAQSERHSKRFARQLPRWIEQVKQS